MPEIPANYRAIEGSRRAPAPGARLVGPADPAETLSVSIRVRRRPGAPVLPEATAVGADPVGQRKFLSREEFAEIYGAAQTDLDKVVSFAGDRGLAVLDISVGRRTVVLSGTVPQMSRAFAIDLNRYESPTGSYRGREGQVHVPADLVGIVEGVFGLDNRKMAKPLFRRSGNPAQITTALTP